MRGTQRLASTAAWDRVFKTQEKAKVLNAAKRSRRRKMSGRFSNTEVSIGACEIYLGGDTEVGVRL